MLIVYFVGNSFYSNSTSQEHPIVIGNGDDIKFHYTLWYSEKKSSYDMDNPYFDDTIWLTVISIVDDHEHGIMLGLYNNLLGKEKFFESESIEFRPCVDENLDGIDDNTERSALSYGQSTDYLFGKYILIKFTIYNIIKTPS